ncbi:MAG: pseudouridylate synthase [Bdellovibrionales bacterium RIFCSPHIGHO2_01_FULL_40_29]|nr:MAG: pseudouridylate synthase [Bdellovibrionales bacterium RIFCSPHIGHO2_01_FULL_40_29]OFZ34046.1 MAG: pseudouridylate synthase [Bdellovibrionales bacterium RIFCSPHIGHO2_02_FULL_40_15]
MTGVLKTTQVRLNKLLAERGVASRRGADKLIEEGQVLVNGKKVYELGVKVNPAEDKITVSGKPLRGKNQNLYIMFNKPKNVITSMNDPLERVTVADYMREVPGRVYPIGRLDWDSEGLLLLTNDGDFAQKVMHPKEEVTKTYHVKLNGQPLLYQIKKLYAGVSIPEAGKVKAKLVEKLKVVKDKDKKTSDKNDWYKIVITEGKNHQVREMFKKIGFDVIKLQRVAIGKLRIGSLERGAFVYLNDAARERVFMQDLPAETGIREHRPKSTKKSIKPTKKKFEKGLRISDSKDA